MRRAVALLFLTGCATPNAVPRFSQSVATSFVREQPRKLVTDDAEIYFPESARPQALRLAAQLKECAAGLRRTQRRPIEHDRALVFLTTANLGNAYVTGFSGGEPLHAVIPVRTTGDFMTLVLNVPVADTSTIACHELTHYLQFEQVRGAWWFVNLVLGKVFQPQSFLEGWFLEGLAEFYEGRLKRGSGRPSNPLYRGLFDSVLASREGGLRGGDLSAWQRDFYPWGGGYLGGLPFVEYLAATYGEGNLWELVSAQGDSVVSPLFVGLRFRDVFGKTLNDLYQEWGESLRVASHARERPLNQQVRVRSAGAFARLASHPSGVLAVIADDRDELTSLRVYEPDGALRFTQTLADFFPERTLMAPSATGVSGLSFDAKGQRLYAIIESPSALGDVMGVLVEWDAHSGERLRSWPGLIGSGGGISPDGEHFLFVEAADDTSRLVELRLSTGTRRIVLSEPGSVSYAMPSYSPDGARIAYARWTGAGFDLFVLEEGHTKALTHDGAFNVAPRWASTTSVLWLHAHQGRAQVHRVDVETLAMEVVSDAPYAAFDPAPLEQGFAFLNRDAEGFSVDVVQSPTSTVTHASEEPAPVPPLSNVEGVESDASALESFFVPQLRLPSFTFGFDSSGNFLQRYSLGLEGKDRLSRHVWAALGLVDLPGPEGGAALTYRNLMLASWTVSGSASLFRRSAATTARGRVSASRTFFDTPASLFASAIGLWKGPAFARYFGLGASFSYFAGASTPNAGLRSGLGLRGEATFYPRGVGSTADVLDVGTTAFIALPLPFLRRQTFTVGVTARALEGAPAGALQLGGLGAPGYAASIGEQPSTVRLPFFVPAAFAESVRGYEDASVAANHAVIGEAAWRYAFVIDRGVPSILAVLPSFFVRQIDAEAFGTAAWSDSAGAPWLRAVGGKVSVRLAVAEQLPVTLYYQGAYRFDLRVPSLHTFGVSFE